MTGPLAGRGGPGLLLAAYLVAVVFIGLGGRGLNEPDEGRYAEIGREMAEGGDWLVPHLNGIPHFQKPPVIYWATALAFRCFGTSEFSARLPPTLAALGILALTFAIGRRLYGIEAAVGSVLVLVAAIEFFALARSLTPDMVMSFWIIAAIFCLVRTRLDGQRHWAWLFFVAMGFGFLTKGPMALVVPVSAAIVWRLGSRGSTPVRPLPWVAGLVLTLAIGLSWFIVLAIREPKLASYFAGYELVQRFSSNVHGRSKPFWFFGPVLLVGLLPWTPAVIAMTAQAFSRWRGGWRPGANAWLLVGWIVPPLIVLSLSGSKLLTYVLPLFPAIAIALAHWHQRSCSTARWAHGVAATLLVLMAVGVSQAHRWLPQGDLSIFIAPLSLVAIGLVAAFSIRQFTNNQTSALACISVAATAGWLWAVSQADRVNDLLGVQPCVRPLTQQVQKAPDLDRATLFVVAGRLHGWEFYLRRSVSVPVADSDVVLPLPSEQQARLLPGIEEAPAVLERRAPAYGVVRARDFEKHFPTNNWAIIGRAGACYLIATRDAALAQPVSTKP